jgi:hypothetical protein
MVEEISWNGLKRIVNRAIGEDLMREIHTYCGDKEIKLWGQSKDTYYMKKNLYLCIYKDMMNVGYLQLYSKIKSWYSNSHKSLAHNIKQFRKILYGWGIKQIHHGTLSEWRNISKSVKKVKALSSVNLWMDSTDYALVGKSDKLKKDPYWSFKKNSMGRRYQAIFDAAGRVRGLWGGYSPKIIDNQWVEMNKHTLKEKFDGSTIIADGHYYASRKKVDGITFVVPTPKTVKKQTNNADDSTKLTKEQQTLNKQIRNLRARVELPFGIIHNKFKALSKTFRDNADQLDYLVFYAFGIYNRQLNN